MVLYNYIELSCVLYNGHCWVVEVQCQVKDCSGKESLYTDVGANVIVTIIIIA